MSVDKWLDEQEEEEVSPYDFDNFFNFDMFQGFHKHGDGYGYHDHDHGAHDHHDHEPANAAATNEPDDDDPYA